MFSELRASLTRPRKVPLALPLPTGKFSIVGHRCQIQVYAKDYPKRARLFVALELRGRVKAQVELARGQGVAFSGVLDFEHLSDVTPRDLLVEVATVWVEDEYGRRERVPIDGASQLSLVRQHLDHDRKVLFTIDLTAGGNLKSLQPSGFSNPEAGLTWTDGSVAELMFPCRIEAGQRYELSMHCWPFLPGTLDAQRMVIDLNGRAKNFSADRYTPAFASLKYQEDDLTDADEVRLRFEIASPGRPCDHGDSGDSRKLGFAFKDMTFSRLLDV